MPGTVIETLSDPDALAARAVGLLVNAARFSIERRGRFTLVLAGGSTPERTYRLLARREHSASIDWSRVFLFFGDERFVPAEDAASNFGMVRRSLLAHLPIPAEHVFPMLTSTATADAAALQYGATISSFFRQPIETVPAPRFDLVLLGLGEDGHTASLFPGALATREERRWVLSSPPGTLPPPVDRITLTFPIINSAGHALFLVAGAKKAGVLKEVLERQSPRDRFPASGVRLTDGDVTWLIDREATSLLSENKR